MSPLQSSLASLDPFQIVGILGFLAYVTNYTLLSLRVLSSECLTYFCINLAAASLVLISLTHDFNLASALIQSFWIVLSTGAIVMRLRRRKLQAVILTDLDAPELVAKLPLRAVATKTPAAA